MRTQSLAGRIVTAFVLMTAVVAGLFSLSVNTAVDHIEMELVAESMNRHLDFIVSELDEGVPPRLGPDLTLHVAPLGERAALPAWLARLEPGLHEQLSDAEAYHVLVRDHAGRRYVLVLDQQDFERREQMLHNTVAAGFVLCLFAAWGLGRLVARTAIAPVVRLSGQVRDRDQLLPLAPALAADYGDDEVGQLAGAFDATLGQLRQALEREQLFTSDASHELRTPLMVIASSCELMLARGDADSAARVHVERIARACGEMQELVETLLGLARAPQAAERSPVAASLAGAADEQLRRWQPEAARRGLALALAHESADAGRYPAPLLRAVLSNLVRNALHHTDHGFVRLVVRCGGFSVIDSGVGIPADQRARMFQPFARGDASRGDGIGIGLSLVQRICDSQGWTIRLDERAGGGCDFRVDFRTS